jgi:hypothetical protein
VHPIFSLALTSFSLFVSLFSGSVSCTSHVLPLQQQQQQNLQVVSHL